MGMNVSSGGSRRRRDRVMSEINVTPMVDVMLVLLVIFMVTAPMLTAGVQVDLPKTAASPLSNQDEPLTVTIRRDGAVYIQETPVELAMLGPKLEAITKQKMDTKIYVRGDKSVEYGKVMTVMGEINAAGFSKVAFLTENSGGKRK